MKCVLDDTPKIFIFSKKIPVGVDRLAEKVKNSVSKISFFLIDNLAIHQLF
jgi:hypothetical protein